jgi:RNA polymerase sigma-70 factor, ECF subfamily
LDNVTAEIHKRIETIWRMESGKITAYLTRILGDIQLAEDIAQDALVIALERWSETGVPEKPGAWLMTTAKHRAFDRIRRDKSLEQKLSQLGSEIEPASNSVEKDAIVDDHIEDDLLRLIFIACHPILSTEARVTLTLRLLGGLTSEEIGRAFLVTEAAIAQRIVRAKRTLAEARVSFELPTGPERTERLSSVLEVIYLIFNEGYSPTSGKDWVRPALCEEALRLGRILAELVPDEGEVHGLVSLMEIQSSRIRARLGSSGEPVLLMEQNRARWDHLLIRRGLAALERAEKIGSAFGPYTLQAAIAACHARAKTVGETDWVKISALYDALAEIHPSPVVELNRAVAVSMAYGPEAGLEVVEPLTSNQVLKDYHLLPAVHGDLLAKLGRNKEACREFAQAAELTRNQREKDLLIERIRELS